MSVVHTTYPLDETISHLIILTCLLVFFSPYPRMKDRLNIPCWQIFALDPQRRKKIFFPGTLQDSFSFPFRLLDSLYFYFFTNTG